MEVQKREELINDKIKNQSRQEQELAYELWRTYTSKEILKENRKMREEKLKYRKERITDNNLQRESDMLRVLRNEFANDLNTMMKKQREAEINLKLSTRTKNYKLCSGIIDYIFDLTEVFYNHQQDRNQLEISDIFLQENFSLFVESKPVLQRISYNNPLFIENLLKSEEKEVNLIYRNLFIKWEIKKKSTIDK